MIVDMIVNSRMIAVQWVRCCSTGFKCKWAIGNHRKVPGRMKTSLPEWTDRSEILLKNSIELKNSILLWNPHHSPSFPMFRRTQNNFCPFNYNMIKVFSWAVTMVTGHAQHCGHRQDDCNCRLFAKSDHTKRALLYKGGCKFVSRDLFTHLMAWEVTVRTFLPQSFTTASPIQNCTDRKIITYTTLPPTLHPLQSNLPTSDFCSPFTNGLIWFRTWVNNWNHVNNGMWLRFHAITSAAVMPCTAQLGGSVLKASGRVQQTSFGHGDKTPMTTDQPVS